MIARDGHTISLWQHSAEPFVPANKTSLNTVYDVIIVGGGITGISTGLLLQEAGKKCLLLEAANLCFGTTGGTTAHLNTLLDTPYSAIEKDFGTQEAKIVAGAARDAIDLIKQNISKYNIECGFQDTDAFLFAQNEQQEKELEKIMNASREAGLDISVADHIPVSIPFTKSIRVAGQARFSPCEYVYALARAFEKAGGVIVQNCRVTGTKSSSLIDVETIKGNYRAFDIVYATHIPPGVNLLHLRCRPYRSYVMAVKLRGNEYPEDLSYDMDDPYHYYRTQKLDGQPYLIAGGNDHKTGHHEDTRESFENLETYIRQYFDVEEIAFKWSSQFFESVDGLPYIGHLPGFAEHIFVATGFGGNGMIYSSVAAITLKNIILGEESPFVSLFNPGRIKPVAGFKQFISHNANVVKEFAGKIFSGEQLEKLADLLPLEGKVVKYEHQKMGLFRDEKSLLHAINPSCSHLNCEVKWNEAEQSWDCPCHGARYNCDGKVLNGPASLDLEQIYIPSINDNKE